MKKLILVCLLMFAVNAQAAKERPATGGGADQAAIDEAVAPFTDGTGAINALSVRAAESIAQKFSTSDDSKYRFSVQDDFALNVQLRTHVPTSIYTADKGAGFFTYGRSTTGTFEDINGIVHTAAINAPRFGGTNYDPATGLHSQIDDNGNLIPTSPAFESGGIWAYGDSQTDSSETWINVLACMLSQRIDRTGAAAGWYINKTSPATPAASDIYTLYTTNIASMGNPALIVLQGGINDINQIAGARTEASVLPGLISNMSAMITDAVGRAERVFVLPIGPFGSFSGYSADKEAARVKYNAWLKSYCSVTGAEYIDFIPLVESPTEAGELSDTANANDLRKLTDDGATPGLHLNLLGNRIIAELMFAKLDRKYLKGLLLEGTATNLLLYSEDFSNEAWVADTENKEVTVAEEATTVSPDGTVGCYSITAVDAGGKVFQNLGERAAAKVNFSIWMKRKTGTGRVYMSLDGGTHLAAVYVDDKWRRVDINTAYDTASTYEIVYTTIADPDPAIVLETSGDAVYVWGAQFEERHFPTSYIATTTAAVERTQDTLALTTSTAFLTNNSGSVGITAIPLWCSEERYQTDTTNSYIFDDATITSRFGLYIGIRALLFLRDMENIAATTSAAISGHKGYGFTDTAFNAGQEIGGITRGQVMRVVGDWTWSTGNAAVIRTYGAGGYISTTAGSADAPSAIHANTLYFNRYAATDTRWFYGYIRDLYIHTSAQSATLSESLSDLVNRW